MSTTTNFHGAVTARADRLESGTVNVALTDDGRNTINVFIATAAEADVVIAAFQDARMLLLDHPGGAK